MVNQSELELIEYKRRGHLEGGIFIEKSSGKKFLLKIPNNHDEAQNEILASKLYQLLGVKTPNLDLINFNGKTAIISEWVENYVNLGYAALPAEVTGLYENFVIDAWFANWDVVGLEFDNIGFVGKEAVRIDLGGSLLYRGMGELKGKLFTTYVSEVCSLLNFSINYNAAFVFKATNLKSFLDGVARISSVSDSKIKSLVFEYAPGDDLQKDDLTDKLLARREDLVTKASKFIDVNLDSFLSVEFCGLSTEM